MFLLTGYVSDGFGRGKFKPIVKDKLGDIGKVTNYRSIAIVCILSKVFESYIFRVCRTVYTEKLSTIWLCKR